MKESLINVLIVGAGVAGKELFRELDKNLKDLFKVVGFIDDDPKKTGSRVNGLKVLGNIQSLENKIQTLKIKEVFIALPSAEGETIKRIIESCHKQKVAFKIVPRILEIVLGKVKLRQVREVKIEDLLGRPIIRSDQQKFLDFFKNKKILVTGSAGSIGSELCRQLIQFNIKQLICFDIWESGLFNLDAELKNLKPESFKIIVGNIQDKKKLENIFSTERPDFVFHAAAYKHVPLMQSNPDEAVKNNVFGTKNLSEIALKNRVRKFINISTDKAADPSSVMGTTKLLAEKIVRNAGSKNSTRFISVRFGNVLDSQGSVVPIFRRQIQEGGPVTVTDPEMTRYFMTIPEAVQLVLEAGLLGKGQETFVLDMGSPVKITDLAGLMIQLSGFIPEKEIQIKYIGKRPGEKLSEILNTDKESLEITSNQKIFRVNHHGSPRTNLNPILETLRKLVYSKKREDLIHFLKQIAPNLQN